MNDHHNISDNGDRPQEGADHGATTPQGAPASDAPAAQPGGLTLDGALRSLQALDGDPALRALGDTGFGGGCTSALAALILMGLSVSVLTLMLNIGTFGLGLFLPLLGLGSPESFGVLSLVLTALLGALLTWVFTGSHNQLPVPGQTQPSKDQLAVVMEALAAAAPVAGTAQEAMAAPVTQDRQDKLVTSRLGLPRHDASLQVNAHQRSDLHLEIEVTVERHGARHAVAAALKRESRRAPWMLERDDQGDRDHDIVGLRPGAQITSATVARALTHEALRRAGFKTSQRPWRPTPLRFTPHHQQTARDAPPSDAGDFEATLVSDAAPSLPLPAPHAREGMLKAWAMYLVMMAPWIYYAATMMRGGLDTIGMKPDWDVGLQGVSASLIAIGVGLAFFWVLRPRNHRPIRALEPEAARPSSGQHIKLSGSHLEVGEVALDLAHPFAARLYRAPEPDLGLVVVELAQQTRRVRLGVEVSEPDSLEGLPLLDARVGRLDPPVFRDTLWPSIEHHAALQGLSLPGTFTDPESDADAAQEQTEALKHEVATTS